MSVKTAEKSYISVLVTPEYRPEYLGAIYDLDGLGDVVEEPRKAYCPISMTLTPDDVKPHLLARQEILKSVLGSAGIHAYDPFSSRYSADLNRQATPEEVYLGDSEKIASCRFFVGHHVIASTGFGNECEKARVYNRISIVLHDKNIRVSRMEPFRTIHLAYSNFEKEAQQFVPVFKLLQDYEPGIGFNRTKPALLGFHKRTGEVVDLEELVYDAFPKLAYLYDRDISRAEFALKNPHLFYENRK